MNPRLRKPDPLEWAYKDCEDVEAKMNTYKMSRQRVSQPGMMGDSIFSTSSEDTSPI